VRVNTTSVTVPKYVDTNKLFLMLLLDNLDFTAQ
jgi:hypothetical protein